MKILFTVFLVLVALAVLSVARPPGTPDTSTGTTTSSDEGLNDAMRRRDSKETEHEYTFQIKGNRADISSGDLQFKISLDAASGPKIFASLKSKGDGKGDGNGERYSLKMFIKRIIEYTPDNTTGYQKGGDAIVKIYGSGTGDGGGKGGGSNWDFGNFIDVNPDSTTDRRFYAITTDGVVNISFRVNVPAGESVADGNITLGLNDIKFDYSIDMDKLKGLGFLQSNGTELAIVGVFQSRLRHSTCNSNSGSSDSACAHDATGSAVGFVRWVNVLNCNNTNLTFHNAIASNDDSEGDSDMNTESSHATVFAWSISNPKNATGVCIWDPVFHLDSSNAAASEATGFVFGVALIISLVSLIF